MKKGLTFFAGSFVLAAALAFGINGAAQSCKGTCNRNYNACVNAATTQAELSQCKKSYQGCISSCK